MHRVEMKLWVDSDGDRSTRSRLDTMKGEPFTVATKSGERMASRIVSVERRVGRKKGRVAQYLFQVDDVNATPEFMNDGDMTKTGTSQN